MPIFWVHTRRHTLFLDQLLSPDWAHWVTIACQNAVVCRHVQVQFPTIHWQACANIMSIPFILLILVNCKWFLKIQVLRTSFMIFIPWFWFFDTTNNIYILCSNNGYIQNFEVIKNMPFQQEISICVMESFVCLFANSSHNLIKTLLWNSNNLFF